MTAVEVRFHACPNLIEMVTSLVGCLQASCIPPIAEGLSKVFFPKVASDETRFRQLFLEVSRFT